jgi:hypothetical protein
VKSKETLLLKNLDSNPTSNSDNSSGFKSGLALKAATWLVVTSPPSPYTCVFCSTTLTVG